MLHKVFIIIFVSILYQKGHSQFDSKTSVKQDCPLNRVLFSMTLSGGRIGSCFVLQFVLMFLILICFSDVLSITLEHKSLLETLKCFDVLCCMQDKTSLIKVNGRQQEILTFLI